MFFVLLLLGFYAPNSFCADQTKKLTINFAGTDKSTVYTIPKEAVWDSDWKNNVTISSNNTYAIIDFLKLIKHVNNETVKTLSGKEAIANFWKNLFPTFEPGKSWYQLYKRRSVLLELIYAVNAQDFLLPYVDTMKYVLKCTADTKSFFMPVTAYEVDQFVAIRQMIDSLPISFERLLPLPITEAKNGINMDYAAMSLDLLFSFVLSLKGVEDVKNLSKDEQNSVYAAFSDADIFHVGQALLWAMRLNLETSRLDTLISIYVKKLCDLVCNNKKPNSLSEFEDPNLNIKIHNALLDEIAQLKENIKLKVEAYVAQSNLMRGDLKNPNHQSNIRKFRNYTSSDEFLQKIYFTFGSTDKYIGLVDVYEELCSFFSNVKKEYKLLLDEEKALKSSIANIASAQQTIQQGGMLSRWYDSATKYYTALVGTLKRNINWIAGAGVVGVAGWLYAKYGRGKQVSPASSSAVTRSLFKTQ